MSGPAGGADRVSTAELSAALAAALDFTGGSGAVARLERRPSLYSTSFPIEELEVRLEDGRALRIMFKDLSLDALSNVAQRAKPSFLYNPLREIDTYRHILAAAGLGTARCYGAWMDAERGNYWLFIEKVRGVELYQVGEFDTWLEVARWLARMHGGFADRAEGLGEQAPLLRHDLSFFSTWMARARAFLARDAGSSRGLEAIADKYDKVAQGLASLPRTLAHGEFYASNVLVAREAAGLRVCPIDWEMAAIGCGLVDLAALIAGKWTEGEKRAIAMAYYGELAAGYWKPAEDEFLRALDCARLHLAVQWLGWSPDWSPPAEHAQDWLNEALQLARKLGLG